MRLPWAVVVVAGLAGCVRGPTMASMRPATVVAIASSSAPLGSADEEALNPPPVGQGELDPVGRAPFMAFLPRYLRCVGLEVPPPVVLEAVVVGHSMFFRGDGPGFDEVALGFDHAELYIVDLNNDGTSDFVLLDTNSVSDHSTSMRVFDAVRGSTELVELKLPAFVGEKDRPIHLDEPFLEVTSRGIVMHWMDTWVVDAHGDAIPSWDDRFGDRRWANHATYLWRQDELHVLSQTKGFVPL